MTRTDPVATAAGKDLDEQYSYDGLDQVVGTNRANEDLDWNYDEIGNWLRFENSETGTQDRSHNDLNQITGITETPPPDWITPVYDGDGRTTLSPRADDPTAGYHHKYDAWGRIVETWVPRPDYPAEKRRILRHCYDARGHRVRTQVHDPANGKLRYTDDFVHDEQWRPVVVVRRDPIPDSDGELSDPYIQRQFLWTPTSEYPDTLVRQDTRTTPGSVQFQERQYALQDDHANTIASVDAGGSVSRRWAYEPFGKADWLDANFNAAPPEPEAWPVLFGGYRMEENTGLYKVRHRAYDPGLGRWLSRDPIGKRGGLNLYAFVGNDGVNFGDLLGLNWTDVYEKSVYKVEVIESFNYVCECNNTTDLSCPCSEKTHECSWKKMIFSRTDREEKIETWSEFRYDKYSQTLSSQIKCFIWSLAWDEIPAPCPYERFEKDSTFEESEKQAIQNQNPAVDLRSVNDCDCENQGKVVRVDEKIGERTIRSNPFVFVRRITVMQ